MYNCNYNITEVWINLIDEYDKCFISVALLIKFQYTLYYTQSEPCNI